MTDINWELLRKLKNEDSLRVQEFVKFLKIEYDKAIGAILGTESEELMKKKVVRAQTLKEILTVLGHSTD